MKYQKEEERKYWEAYYENHRLNSEPSLFAQFVTPFIKDDTRLLELGCGNGRDSIFFAKNNTIKVTALDQCQDQIDFLNSLGHSNMTFEAADFTNYKSEGSDFDYIYSRFTLHSVDQVSEQRTFKNSYDNMRPNGLMLIEVRSIFDDLMGEGTQVSEYEFITDHYRRFVKIEEMINNGLAANFKLLYKLQSKDLAPYRDQNPVIIRLIFQKA